MSRTWLGITVAVGVALFALVVHFAVRARPDPRGWSGLEFAALTPGASARTPLLARGGAMIFDVTPDSPAAKAKIKPGEVVAAIDGKPVVSARQASELVRGKAAGESIALTLYDVTKGEVHPKQVALVFDAAPPVTKAYSVRPPRTLAREFFYPPFPAANAAWSRRIRLGATIRPLALTGLGAGQCNGFAPQEWRVAAHAPDNSLFHVMANEGFQHAVFKSAAFNGDADGFVKSFLEETFGASAVLTPPQQEPYGFVQRDFGNQKGGAGFVLYRVTGKRIALWVAAVPGGDVGWAKPQVGAVVLSMRCAAPGAPGPQARPGDLLATRISTRCIQGQCSEGDFAGAYLTTLRLGYVHNDKGQMFLVHPRRDYWQNGAQGPGFYHQIGGENEKLEPGRIN